MLVSLCLVLLIKRQQADVAHGLGPDAARLGLVGLAALLRLRRRLAGRREDDAALPGRLFLGRTLLCAALPRLLRLPLRVPGMRRVLELLAVGGGRSVALE